MMGGEDLLGSPPRGSWQEQCWRRQRFRSHQPSPWERVPFPGTAPVTGLRAPATQGRVLLPRRTATLWALLWTPLRWGGLGTNPEYAVKSTDRFLTSLARIRVEIKDQGKVPVLKFWVRRSPVRPLPPWAKATLAGLAQASLAARYKGEGNAENGGNATLPPPRHKPGMWPGINR